uniref:C2H2-type domain-containing protein n=1 Tax=Romanomermis culicivorax TaxID=13658 RepID=A0A915II42_ROMCU
MSSSSAKNSKTKTSKDQADLSAKPERPRTCTNDASVSLHRCPICPKIFKRKPDLARHILHHNQIKNFSCPICSTRFMQKVHLRRHIEAKHGTTTTMTSDGSAGGAIPKLFAFRCSSCPKSFRTNSELKRHRALKHKYADNMYKCRYCGAKFDDQKTYINHLDFHNGLKSFACSLCSTSFRRKTELERHTAAKHGFGTYYACKICEVEFSQRIQLDRHILKAHVKTQHNMANDHAVKEDFAAAAYLESRNPPESRRNQFFACIYCKCAKLPFRFSDRRSLLNHHHQEHYTLVFKDAPTNSSSIVGNSTSGPSCSNFSASPAVVVPRSAIENKPKQIFTTVDVQLILKITIEKLKKSPSIIKLPRKFLPDDFILAWRPLEKAQSPSNASNGDDLIEFDLKSYKCREGETILVQTAAKKVVLQGLEENIDRKVAVVRLDDEEDKAIRPGAVYMIEANYSEQ